MGPGELTRTEPESGQREHDAQREHSGAGAEVAGSDNLPLGAARTLSGRISAAREFSIDSHQPTSPFSSVELTRLDEALTLVSRHTKLRFSIFLGDLGEDSSAGARHLFDSLGAAGADSVLLAVDPTHRAVDIITGPRARLRLPDRGCKLAVMSMVASFKEGDLLGGLLSGLRMLSDQAGAPWDAGQ